MSNDSCSQEAGELCIQENGESYNAENGRLFNQDNNDRNVKREQAIQRKTWDVYRDLKSERQAARVNHPVFEDNFKKSLKDPRITSNWPKECMVRSGTEQQISSKEEMDPNHSATCLHSPAIGRYSGNVVSPELTVQRCGKSSSCYNTNNKYANMNLQFQSPNRQCGDDMEYDTGFDGQSGTHRAGATSSRHRYDSIPDSAPMKCFQRINESSSSIFSDMSDDQLRNRNMKNLNTNWTPTFEQKPHFCAPINDSTSTICNTVSRKVQLNNGNIGSCVDRMWCNAIDCGCNKNQWSPFLSPFTSKNLKEPFDETLAYDVSYNNWFIDSGPYISPSSLEREQKLEDFEVVCWDSQTDSDYQNYHTQSDGTKNGTKNRAEEGNSEAFNTAPNTPELDLSHLDGWHTAPNTPENDSTDFCIINLPEEMFVDDTSTNRQEDTLTNRQEDTSPNRQEEDIQTQFAELCRATTSDSQVGNNSDCRRKKSKISTSESALDSFTTGMLADLPKCDTEQINLEKTKLETISNEIRKKYPIEPKPINAPFRLFDEIPIIYSADTVEYLVDTDTGNARTCGKGSFGQVYNARFSDPALYHIPIVVKEFDEEFTNKKEILLEAQRLMYLQDTGYVPICYGMIELDHENRRSYGIIQEYVGDGTTLEQILWERMQMPLYNWLTIALQCCDGLARFHDKGILLNDIKSNNIIIIFYGNGYVCIKYIDFGLATDMRGRSYRNTKSLEEFVYIAPEVRIGRSRTTVASDIFSLGYMLDQIKQYADVCELKFVIELCMQDKAHCRIPVKAAIRLIEEQMEGLNMFNDDNISE